MKSHLQILPLLTLLSLPPLPVDAAVQVVASTSLVGDIVRQIGGDRIELTVLAAAGVDPHGFDPTPQDAKRLHDAGVIFLNGAGLEAGLDRLISAADAKDKVCVVSEGIALLDADGDCCAAGHDHGHGEPHDPHVWFDPLRVKTWGTNIAERLGTLDPAGRDRYTAARAELDASLDELDAWIRSQVALIPQDRRQIAIDHQVLGYFVSRYGFAKPITLNEGFSSTTQPDVRAITEIIRAIRKSGAHALFVGVTVNDELARQVAAETRVPVVRLHTCTLGGPGSGAETYQQFMRTNVKAIAGALQ
ncbi:MAG: metal ABC transporter substrate-binding protein [Kiritimatiellia bacterium]